MKNKELYSLFPDHIGSTENHINEPMRTYILPSIYSEFVAKRNAAKIDHYFINIKFNTKRTISILIFAVLIFLSFILFLRTMNQVINDRFEYEMQEALHSIGI